MKRIYLVTGGAGFIGSHLVDALIEKGHRVSVIDSLVSGRTENINPQAKFYKADFNDSEIDGIFDAEKPETVYHLAFNTNVPLSVREPFYDAQSITGSVKILENCRRIKIAKIIFSSSGFIYGNTDNFPTKENEPFKPIAPYSISKYAVEQYLHFYQNVYAVPFVIFRFATVYGPRQIGQALNAYIEKIFKDERAELYGEKPKTRDYIFVKDVVAALLLALDYNLEPSVEPIFNVGTGKETSLSEAYALIAKLLSKKNEPIYKPGRPGELERYCLDYSKIKKIFGWKPKYDLETGLKEVLKYKKLL